MGHKQMVNQIFFSQSAGSFGKAFFRVLLWVQPPKVRKLMKRG